MVAAAAYLPRMIAVYLPRQASYPGSHQQPGWNNVPKPSLMHRKTIFSNTTQSTAIVTAILTILAASTLALSPSPVAAQPLDLGDWQIYQYDSNQTYTIPVGTIIQPGGYLILCRFATQAAFESFYGVTLDPDVIYLTNSVSNPVVPMINGDEVYELYNASGGLVDGPTPAITTTFVTYHRDDPEAAPWTSIDTNPTPGSGVEPPDAVFSGMVITEVNDASGGGNYVYEYIELYFDNGGGGSNQEPVITGTQHTPLAPQTGDDLLVETNVTDPDGSVVEVLCYWRQSGGSYTQLVMSGAGDFYSATIPNLQGDSLLEYYITAEDDAGAIATDPAGAPTVVHAVWVQGEVVPGKVILFDHAHAQDAGDDGNWRIDDNFPFPLPADPHSESDWSGQLSSWAYELYLAGHTLRSNTSPLNASQLVGVDLLIIDEPQNPFTSDEIAAVSDFVFDGGSLFVIANHNSSDRNGNGWDSASIFGGYSQPHITDPPGSDPETFCGALFGLHFHVKDEGNNSITGTFSNVDSDPSNPIIHGLAGDVSAVIYHVGNVMALWPAANPYLSDVAGHIWKDGDTGNPDVNIAAWSRYGSGKVMGYGDSSSCADGTGSEPHANNWLEPGSNNREFFMNATWWLLTDEANAVGEDPGDDGRPALPGLTLRAWPNPFNPVTTISYDLPIAGWTEVAVFDLRGRKLRTLASLSQTAGQYRVSWNGTDDHGHHAPSGVYLIRASVIGQGAATQSAGRDTGQGVGRVIGQNSGYVSTTKVSLTK